MVRFIAPYEDFSLGTSLPKAWRTHWNISSSDMLDTLSAAYSASI
jgi:hypothetical protein